jgi:AcrR family transcriptional regulator
MFNQAYLIPPRLFKGLGTVALAAWDAISIPDIFPGKYKLLNIFLYLHAENKIILIFSYNVKEEIIKVSLSGFLKHGIRKMTVQNLVSPLGISTKTVYKYFKNKEDLLKECLVLHYTILIRELLESVEKCPNAVQAMATIWNQTIKADFGVAKSFYHDLNYYYPSLQDGILKKYGNRITNTVIDVMNRGIKEGYFIGDLNPLLSFKAMTVLYSSITRTDQYKNLKLPANILAEQTVFVYLRGICTEKGLKELNT